MQNTKTKKVKMELVGLDGNAFSLMAAFIRAAKAQGWTQEESKAVIDEATSSDYKHLVATIASNVSIDPDDWDDDDEDEDGNQVDLSR
jgi:hypothetical protein